MNEVWKDIKGYEGVYQVSNHGRVRSLNHSVVQMNNGTLCKRLYKGRVLTQRTSNGGYKRVHLSNGKNNKWYSVHRLVAFAFCEKPDGNDIVNHIDNNPDNNRAENLEWTTYKGNMQHASKQGRMHYQPDNLKRAQLARNLPVIATDKSGHEITYKSITEACKSLNLSESIRGHISSVCKGEYGCKTAGGYRWRYANEI